MALHAPLQQETENKEDPGGTLQSLDGTSMTTRNRTQRRPDKTLQTNHSLPALRVPQCFAPNCTFKRQLSLSSFRCYNWIFHGFTDAQVNIISWQTSAAEEEKWGGGGHEIGRWGMKGGLLDDHEKLIKTLAVASSSRLLMEG